MKMSRWLLLGFLATPGLAWGQDGKPAEDDKGQDKEKGKPAAKVVDDASPRRAMNSMERSVQAAQRQVQQAQREMERAVKQQVEAANRANAASKTVKGMEGNRAPNGNRVFSLSRSSNAPSRFVTIYGFDLAEADPVLRSQLKIPADQGLVVTRVNENGLADQAGLKVNDLILKLDDKDAAKPDQAREVLTKAGSNAVQVKLIRAGEPRQLSLVGPEHGTPTATYWIGVNVAPIDATLRSHLTSLPAEAGLIATEVIADSPAARAGVQKSDILAKIDDKPLTNQEAMVALIQKSEGKPVAIELYRAGKPQTLTATPEKRAAARYFSYSESAFPEIVAGGPRRFTVTVPFNGFNGQALDHEAIKNQVEAELKRNNVPGLNYEEIKDRVEAELKGVAPLVEAAAAQNGGVSTTVTTVSPAVAEANAKLQKEVKDLSGKIEELEKLIRELGKDKASAKEKKD